MKIGFVSLPLSGHLNPMTALARKLQSRGHEVVFIGVPDAGPIVRAAGLNFVPYCEKEYPVGSIAELYAPVSKLHGLEVMKYSCEQASPGLTQAAFDHLPAKLIEHDVEAMVIDTIHFFIELVPLSMGIPYVHIWNVLHTDLTGTTPACFFDWPHNPTPHGLNRNIEGLQHIGSLFAPIMAVAAPYAEKVGLNIDWTDPTATVSRLAVITQTPQEFDFPDSPWPDHFHFAGPFHDNKGREPVPFPWEDLTGRPLIYASLGTLVNGLDHVYKAILEAVAKLPELQLVLSIGNNIDADQLGPIPTDTVIVRSAPQIALLQYSALCITNAGLNPTLESLAQGVPMVAIPIAYDQPGVAARIAHHGVGEFVNVENLTVDRLLELIQQVLKNLSYREKARSFQKVIAQKQGRDVAVDVIEHAFQKHQWVTAVRELSNSQ